MSEQRFSKLISKLSDQTVLGEMLQPAIDSLDYVRKNSGGSRNLTMPTFITLGVQRHLKGVPTLREHVQSLMHIEEGSNGMPPLARSTLSDALASPERHRVIKELIPVLVRTARKTLPDRFAKFESLANRPIYAVDGSYQKESVHYKSINPSEGGEDNPKGHAMMTFFDLRLGLQIDVFVETSSHHEMFLFKEYLASYQVHFQQKNALYLLDRAYISALFWDKQKKETGTTMISRMKSNLIINSREKLEFSNSECNQGVSKDEKVMLNSSKQSWRLITYITP
jgi:hypothetical protein